MKLHHTASPYVCKVEVTAIASGLDDAIERLKRQGASVWVGNGDPAMAAANPLGKAPTLITCGGTVLIDATLIREPTPAWRPTPGCYPWREANAGGSGNYRRWPKA